MKVADACTKTTVIGITLHKKAYNTQKSQNFTKSATSTGSRQ